jgi:hypothetical protein
MNIRLFRRQFTIHPRWLLFPLVPMCLAVAGMLSATSLPVRTLDADMDFDAYAAAIWLDEAAGAARAGPAVDDATVVDKRPAPSAPAVPADRDPLTGFDAAQDSLATYGG